MPQVLISTKYQIVIPKTIRRQMGLTPGQKLNIGLTGNQITLSPSHALSWPDDYYPIVKDLWTKPGEAEKYLEDERNSWD